MGAATVKLSEEHTRSYIDDIRWVELLKFLTWKGDAAPTWTGQYMPATRSDDADLVSLARFNRCHYLYYRALIEDHVERRGCVMDLGCGTGQRTNMLTRYAEKVIGVDVEPLKVAAAQFLNGGGGTITYIFGNIMEAGVNEFGPFDYVFCVDVVEHIALDSQVAFVRRAMEGLVPGGKLLLTTPRDKKIERKHPHIGLWDAEMADNMAKQFGAPLSYYNVKQLDEGGEDPRSPLETATHYVMVVTK